MQQRFQQYGLFLQPGWATNWLAIQMDGGSGFGGILDRYCQVTFENGDSELAFTSSLTIYPFSRTMTSPTIMTFTLDSYYSVVGVTGTVSFSEQGSYLFVTDRYFYSEFSYSINPLKSSINF